MVGLTCGSIVGRNCGTHIVGSYGAHGGAHMWDPCPQVPHMGSNVLESFLVVESADPMAHTFLSMWLPHGARKCTRISYKDMRYFRRYYKYIYIEISGNNAFGDFVDLP